MGYPLSVSVIGPSLALEQQGWIYKVWNLLENKIPDNSPYATSSGLSPYSTVEIEVGGTFDPTSPLLDEQSAFDTMYDQMKINLSRHKTKKK
jgi:hypothetical protein